MDIWLGMVQSSIFLDIQSYFLLDPLNMAGKRYNLNRFYISVKYGV